MGALFAKMTEPPVDVKQEGVDQAVVEDSGVVAVAVDDTGGEGGAAEADADDAFNLGAAKVAESSGVVGDNKEVTATTVVNSSNMKDDIDDCSDLTDNNCIVNDDNDANNNANNDDEEEEQTPKTFPQKVSFDLI